MPLFTVDLDRLRLTYHKRRIRVSVTSRAEFKFPPGVPLHHNDVAGALASGALWVGHARTCRIDIQVSLNDRPLNSESNAQILEALGNDIIGANLWSQLSLSPSLDTSQSDDLESTKSDISILLNQCSSSSTSAAYPHGWILENMDVKPPPAVPTVQFNGLRIKLDFYTIQARALHGPKRVKYDESPESMLLDRPEDIDRSHFQVFDDALDGLTHNLRCWIHRFVQLTDVSLLRLKMPLPDYKSTSSSNLLDLSETATSFSSTTCTDIEAKNPDRRHILSDSTRYKLQAWLQSNLSNPYPENREKIRLMRETGLDGNQLNRWFYNARSRLSKPSDEQVKDPLLLEVLDNAPQHSHVVVPSQQEHMQLTTQCSLAEFCMFDQGMPSSDQHAVDSGDSMPSFLGDATPDLASPASTKTSVTRSPNSPNKRMLPIQANNHGMSNLPLSSSSMLTSAALNVVIGGSACKRGLSSIGLQSSFPDTPLSTLVPSVFCPGFKQMMAHSSRFLPTISQAISSSWVRNCQGPGLRRKLLELSNLSPPGADFGQVSPAGESGSAERLRTVVQRRMWAMMQRKLSDPAAVSKLKWDVRSTEGTAGIDNLDYGDEGYHVNKDPAVDTEEFMEERYEDDDELLFRNMSDDEGLLSYFDEMERLEVEKQTDEMLFGGEEYEADSDIELLLDESNEETMLLYSAWLCEIELSRKRATYARCNCRRR